MSTASSERLRQHAHRTELLSEALRERRGFIAPRLAAVAHTTAPTHSFIEDRRIFDCGETDRLPGTLVRDEGEKPVGDRRVNEAYTAAGSTWDFYRTIFERDSIDARGMHLISSVHYSQEYDNAFWDGAQMVYGDGDGELFGPFTHCLDVIGHELTHGVTQIECDLTYDGQSGALNESISDVFGTLVKQWKHGQSVETADWLIGSGLFVAHSGVHALRSLKAPGTAYDDPRLGGRDPQPAHMRDYYDGAEDNDGVHINSGIPNHAFYLAAMGFGGNAWDRAGRVWYDALTSGLRASTTFATFARATTEAAQHRFGPRGARIVAGAWHEVGVYVHVHAHA